MTSNQVFENCQLEKSHWKLNYIVTTEYIILAKINIPSSYLTILILICLENTLKLLFDSCVTSVKFKTKWLDQIPTLLESSVDSWLRYSKITHRYAKNSPFTWFLYLKLPIDTDFIHFICQFHYPCGINAREYFKGQLHLSQACFDCLMASLILITTDNGRGPRLDLSGTPGLRPIGLSPSSWQTSLGLGSMSRYSAQILICIANVLNFRWHFWRKSSLQP